LGTNRIDLAVVALPIEEPGVETASLFEEPFVVAAGLEFDRPGKHPVKGSELREQNILLLEEGHCLRDQTIQACGINVNTALNQFGASSLATIVEMVANGFGITLLPRMALEKEASDSRLKLFDMAMPGPSRELGIAWRTSSPYGSWYEEVGEVIKSAST